MLRPEHGDEVHPGVRVQYVDQVAGVGGDPGGVGDDPDALPGEFRVPVGGEPLEAGAHPVRRGGRHGPSGRGDGSHGPHGSHGTRQSQHPAS